VYNLSVTIHDFFFSLAFIIYFHTNEYLYSFNEVIYFIKLTMKSLLFFSSNLIVPVHLYFLLFSYSIYPLNSHSTSYILDVSYSSISTKLNNSHNTNNTEDTNTTKHDLNETSGVFNLFSSIIFISNRTKNYYDTIIISSNFIGDFC